MLSRPATWDRVNGFDLDAAGGQSFVRRLMHQNGWDEPFARQAIEEYRRFLYLAEVSVTEVRMSPALWDLWSFHRREAQGNWTGFISTVSGDPSRYSRLRPADNSELDARTYDSTRALYQREFGIAPPEALWPPLPDSIVYREDLAEPRHRAEVLSFSALGTTAFLTVLFLVLGHIDSALTVIVLGFSLSLMAMTKARSLKSRRFSVMALVERPRG